MKSPSVAAPRYNLDRMSLNPPYQINYRAKRAGKHISASKRRITFQFGFSNAKAIANGLVGKECRGEEHEVVLVWSHVTGKRQVFLDSREIHASKVARGNTKFEHAWSAFGGHTLKIVANWAPPKQYSGERQFDLELDGMSFFQFSQIYQLGDDATNSAAESGRAYSYRGATYDARDDEEGADEPSPAPEAQIDLFDTQPSPSLSPSSNNSVPSMVGSSTSSSNSAFTYDEFLPVEHTAPKQKTFESVSSEILCAYNAKAPSMPDLSKSAPSSSRALVPVSEEGMDAVSKSMSRLVNLDDITTSAVTPIVPDSPSLGAMKKGQANWGLVGRAPTLAEIRDSVAHGSTSAPAGAVGRAPPAQHGYYGAPQNVGYY